jgi:FdhD protein
MKGTGEIPTRRVTAEGTEVTLDRVAIEEPLEIRLVFGQPENRTERSISVTMRTPGDDIELALGFLFTEGVITGKGDIVSARHCGRPGAEIENVVRIELMPGVEVKVEKLDRNFYTASSCGVCGKSSIEALERRLEHVGGEGLTVSPDLLMSLPERGRQAQANFSITGGVHAAALFDRSGRLLLVREDVGRHNAVDKVIGVSLLNGALPLRDTLLLVSGRASFELVQKALAAGIPLLAAVGAPSTLACRLAETYGMTLVGFLRDGRFNVYSSPERIGAMERGVNSRTR